MSALLQIDQVGLSEGTPGKSRTDGLSDGAEVTLTDTSSTGTTQFRLLWVPPGDTSAVSTLAVTGNPRVWTFTPSALVYGSYRIELLRNAGLSSEQREVRIFGVRTPNAGLLIPALSERGVPTASLENAGADIIERTEQNADDFTSDVNLNNVRNAGWWRAMHEAAMVLDTVAAGGSGPSLGTLLGAASRLVAGTEDIGCPPGTRVVHVHQVAGGAGGGAAAQTASPSQTNSGGGGGGSGAEQEYIYVSATDIETISVVVGAGGSPGVLPGSGGDGGDTTVTIDGQDFVSSGGDHGSNGSVTGAPLASDGQGGQAGLVNTQTGSQYYLLRSSGGQPGSPGTGPNGALGTHHGGNGGSSTFGGGGRGGTATDGGNGNGNGSGGGGGSSSAGIPRAGGQGTPGAVSFKFYSAIE
jgi:hypothetical protein